MIFYFCYSISFKSLFLFILKAFYVGSISALSVFQNRKLQFTLIMKIEALCTSFSDFVFRLPSKHVAGDPVVRDCRKGKNFYCRYYSKSTTLIDCVEKKQKQGDSCLSLASLRALTVQKKKNMGHYMSTIISACTLAQYFLLQLQGILQLYNHKPFRSSSISLCFREIKRKNSYFCLYIKTRKKMK